MNWKTATGRRHFFSSRTGADTIFEDKTRTLSSHVAAGERRRHCRQLLAWSHRPRARAYGFQLRPLQDIRSPMGPREMGMGALASPAGRGNLETRTPLRARRGPSPLPGLGPYGSLVRMLTVISMPTMDSLAGSRCTVLCTKMWDTSMCITRCASGWDATSVRTTAILEARLSSALPTRSQVSPCFSQELGGTSTPSRLNLSLDGHSPRVGRIS